MAYSSAESERDTYILGRIPGDSRPYDNTYTDKINETATRHQILRQKIRLETTLANSNITGGFDRPFNQKNSGLSETSYVMKWDEQPTTSTPSCAIRSDFVLGSENRRRSLKKRCLFFLIIMFIFALSAAAIVPAVILTWKKDSDDSPDVLERVDMQAKITNFNFTPGLNDNTSDEYYNFTHSFCDQITTDMTENNQDKNLVKDIHGCTVWSISSGSVVVKFTVVISHEGNNRSPTSAEIKILIGVDDRITGTVEIGKYTIDVEAFYVRAILVVTVDNNPLPTLVSYGSNCKSVHECETYFARCLDGKCACTENRYHNSIDDSCVLGLISFELDTFIFLSGQEAIMKCSFSNIPNWQHAYMKKTNGKTIYSVWNDTGFVRVTDAIKAHGYTAFHSLGSTFDIGFNISSIICEDAGVYICAVEADNYTVVKSANTSVSLTGNATNPIIFAPEFMNEEHGLEIICKGNIGLNKNGLTGNLSLIVTIDEISIPISQEISPQCDGYVEAEFMASDFPNNITKVTVRCETSTVEGRVLVSQDKTVEVRSTYASLVAVATEEFLRTITSAGQNVVSSGFPNRFSARISEKGIPSPIAFPAPSYLLKIGQPGSIVCDVANIVNWNAVVVSKSDNADFIKVFPDGTNNLQNGSNVDLSNSTFTNTAVKLVVIFNNVSCSDAAMKTGTSDYTCTAQNGDAVLGKNTTKITFQRPPGFPFLSMAERVYERSDSYGAQEFSCKGQVGSPPGEIYVESTFMDDSGMFQTFLTSDDTTKVDSRYGWVNVGPINTKVACGLEVEMKFALREPPLSLHRQKLRCAIKPSKEIVNEETVYSDEGIILVVPESICESEINPNSVEHPYTCNTFVQCSAKTFTWAAPTGCKEDQCYNKSSSSPACTDCMCQKRAQTIDEFACEENTIKVSLDKKINIDCSLKDIGTIIEIEILKDGKLYNSTLIGQSTFTGKLGKIDVHVESTAKTATFGIASVSCEDEGSYLIKINSLSEEIIVEVSSEPKQPKISVPVASYVNQEMIVQCMGYIGRTPQGAATRLQLQSHAAHANDFIVYGGIPTNKSMECSDTTCECYETLFFTIFPTLSMNNSGVRCAALASDGSLVVSSEEKVVNLVQGDIYFSGGDVTAAIGRRISLECVLLNGLGANGAIVQFNPNNSVGDTELCVVPQSGVGNCTAGGFLANATNMDSTVQVYITIANISCSNAGRYFCTSFIRATSKASIHLNAYELPKAPKLKLSRQIIDGQGTWGDRPFYCSGELGPDGAITIEWTMNGTFVPLFDVNDTDNSVALIVKDYIVQQTSTCSNEVSIPFAFHTAYVNSELHGKRLRCKTSPSTDLGLDVLYSNEEEIKVVNSSYCIGKEDRFHVHPFHCNLYIQCGSNRLSGMHACQDNYCWDASVSLCKSCEVVGCQVEFTTTTPGSFSEQINCFPEDVSVYNGTRPGVLYCNLVNVEQINILNIYKDENLLWSIISPSEVNTFGDFISLGVDRGAISVSFGTVSCKDEGEYLMQLNNDTRAKFFVWVVSNAEIPVLNITSSPKLNQFLKLTCTAILGRGPGGTERTQVVLQRRKNGEAFEEYGATHMSDCTTSQCVCFVEAEYSVLLYESWNETDVRCALKNTSTNVIEEDLTSSESTLILGDTEIYFVDVNKSATIGTRVELICKLLNGQGDEGVKITRTSDNLNCTLDGSMNQIHCDLGYSVSSEESGDHQVVILTIESMGCIDESEYHCSVVKDPFSYASLRLEAQADPKEPILIMPLTTVENIPTPFTALNHLWCLANIGSDTNRVVQIEIQRSGESRFSAFNLKTAETPETTSENCEVNVTISYKGIKFDNSYNNSKVRCSVYQNLSSTDPMVSSQVYDVTLLPESICDEVTNTTLYLPYPYSYPGSCRKYVLCYYGKTFVSIYTRGCPSTLCPIFTDNWTSFYCGHGCSEC